MKTFFLVVVASLLGILLAFLFSDTARAQHDNIRNEPLLAYAMCPTLEGALAVIEAPNPRIGVQLWSIYKCASAGPNYGVRVVIHKIVEELVWAGDGLGDMMLVMEVYARYDQPLWVWVVKAKFARRFPGRLRLLQPTAI